MFDLKAVTDVAGDALNTTGEWAKSTFGPVPGKTAELFQNIGADVERTTSQVGKTFNMGAQAVTVVVKDSAAQVNMLVDRFGHSCQEAIAKVASLQSPKTQAQIMTSLGIDPVAAVDAIKKAFSAETYVNIVKDLNLSPDQAFSVLKEKAGVAEMREYLNTASGFTEKTKKDFEKSVDQVEEAAKKESEKAKKDLEKAGKDIEKAGKDIEDAGKKAGDALGKLFG